jgi:hypothetical protein
LAAAGAATGAAAVGAGAEGAAAVGAAGAVPAGTVGAAAALGAVGVGDGVGNSVAGVGVGATAAGIAAAGAGGVGAGGCARGGGGSGEPCATSAVAALRTCETIAWPTANTVMAVMNEMRIPPERVVPDVDGDADTVSLNMPITTSTGANGCRDPYVADMSVHERPDPAQTLSAFVSSVARRQTAVTMTFF